MLTLVAAAVFPLATLVLEGSGPFAVEGLLASLRIRRERYITAPVGRARPDIR
jgi:hypothetical protein